MLCSDGAEEEPAVRPTEAETEQPPQAEGVCGAALKQNALTGPAAPSSRRGTSRQEGAPAARRSRPPEVPP
eukprot:6614564-Prymnesium_polylepis.1